MTKKQKKQKKEEKQLKKNPVDFTMMITILLLLALGLVMVLSASSPTSLAKYNNSYVFFVKQLIFGALGVIAMCIISKIDYRFWKNFYKIGSSDILSSRFFLDSSGTMPLLTSIKQSAGNITHHQF